MSVNLREICVLGHQFRLAIESRATFGLGRIYLRQWTCSRSHVQCLRPPTSNKVAKTPYLYVYTCTCIYIPEGSIASHMKSSWENRYDRESLLSYRRVSAQYPVCPLISVLCATFLAFYLRALRHDWIWVGGSRKQGLTHTVVMWAPMRLRICILLL